MKWRTAIGLLTTALLSIAPLAQAQQPAKIPRVGLLAGGRGFGSAGDAFRQALRRLGWMEGKNVVIQSQLAEVNLDKLPELATDLVRRKVTVIVADGDPAIQAAKRATGTIPIVLIAVGDPVTEGFVASLAKPGGNITGLIQIARELSGKRLELLKEAFPKISRVAVFVDAALTAEQLSFGVLQEIQAAANVLGIKVQSLEVAGPDPDLDGAFRTATNQRVNALMILPGPVLIDHKNRVVDQAAKARLPAMYPTSEFVGAGGLMSYAPDLVDLYRRAATYVDKILKGAKPANLPVEQPSKFELVINLKTAKQIGSTIPPNALARADRVIR